MTCHLPSVSLRGPPPRARGGKRGLSNSIWILINPAIRFVFFPPPPPIPPPTPRRHPIERAATCGGLCAKISTESENGFRSMPFGCIRDGGGGRSPGPVESARTSCMFLTLFLCFPRVCPSDATKRPPCGNYEFTCDDGTCISSSYVCDSVPDCPDHSDELHCPSEYTTSSRHKLYII